MPGKIWRTFGTLALGSIALGAQQQPPPAPLPEVGASIDVRVVNVEAVVTGRRGDRVEGLKAADFRLLVDGREVPIDYFTEVRGGEAVASPAGPTASAPDGGSAAPPPPASPVPAGPVGMSYLVFIDEWLAITPRRDLLLTQLENDLRIGPEDRMAIVAYDGRKLDLLSDWTGDRDALRRTLEAARLRPCEGLKRLVLLRQNEEDETLGLEGLYVESPDLFWEVQNAAAAAVAAMRGLSAPPGRKALLLLTSVWPPLPRYPQVPPPLFGELPSAESIPPAAADLFEPLTSTANLLGYTIYPLFMPVPVVGTNWADASRMGPMPPGMLEALSSSWDFGGNETMRYVARETGGVPIFNSWRQGPLARVEKDTGSYYWLGFTPEWRADGRSHQIRVEVRRAGLTVRSRSGFADLSPAAQASLRTDNLLLFGNGQGVRQIQAEAGAPRRAGFGTIEVPVTLILPADLLTPLPVEGGYELRARLAMTSLDNWGFKTEQRNLALRLKLPAMPAPGDLTRYQTRLKLRKVDQQLVFAVQDEVGDGQGRAELELKP